MVFFLTFVVQSSYYFNHSDDELCFTDEFLAHFTTITDLPNKDVDDILEDEIPKYLEISNECENVYRMALSLMNPDGKYTRSRIVELIQQKFKHPLYVAKMLFNTFLLNDFIYNAGPAKFKLNTNRMARGKVALL